MALGEIMAAIEESALDNTLSNYFGWAGKSFPYAGAADVTISIDTVWDDTDADVKKGFKKVKTLTIAAGKKLSINKSPFYIFAEGIVFGDTNSSIDISGPSGSSALLTFPSWCAKGSKYGTYAQGGCGGGLLFIVCRKISGAAGQIKANGGNGWRNTDNASNLGAAGLGTFDTTVPEFTQLLVSGGTHGTATGNPVQIYGGGGIAEGGGGTATNSTANGRAGRVPAKSSTPDELLWLARFGLLGGGGGGAGASSDGACNFAGGGGGGAICVWARDLDITPALIANGGIGACNAATTCPGGAGITHLIQV